MTPNLSAFSRLRWENRFTAKFPIDPEKQNFVRTVRNVISSEVAPTPVRQPRLLAWSDPLALELGICRPNDNDPESLALLAGNASPNGATPYAVRYGGHQFGNWAGQLGDGRAITLGEANVGDLGSFEFQLKGAGPTPYARRADGRAVLRSSVREYLCSEAMHFLGVPTTRALSLVLTGEEVIRDMFYDGNAQPEPGAIVCRVSPSFLRFGNFEILAASGELDLLKDLANYLIANHYPELSLHDGDVYGKLLDEIAARTARLMAHWMRVGFVHGVMNTDNMSALGLTIDYGPYGWLEPYDPYWTPNTTDAEGRRYRFGNQPAIAQWNLARLCEAFYPIIQDEARLNDVLATYRQTFELEHLKALERKLGIQSFKSDQDHEIIDHLFELMGTTESDYTLFFRELSSWDLKAESFTSIIEKTSYLQSGVPSDAREKWSAWATRYRQKIQQEGQSAAERTQRMKQANPCFVLRNYLAQQAIEAATQGDLGMLERLQKALQDPYSDFTRDPDLIGKRPDWAREKPGCSALSCSS